MKRSTMVGLVLAAGAGGAVYYATQSSMAYEEELVLSEKAHVVASVEECVSVTGFSRAECSEAAARALKDSPHAQSFASAAECEATFGAGKCGPQQAVTEAAATAALALPQNQAQDAAAAPAQQASSSSGSLWMPLMTGFLIREAMMRASNGATSRTFFSQPTFGGAQPATAGANSAGRSFALGDGSRFQANSRGATTVPLAHSASSFSRQQPSVASRAASTMRGGFGSSGRSATS